MNKVIEFFKELGMVYLIVTISVVFTNGIISFFDTPLDIKGYIGLMILSTIVVCIMNLIYWICKIFYK
jgi:hypothetical protein